MTRDIAEAPFFANRLPHCHPKAAVAASEPCSSNFRIAAKLLSRYVDTTTSRMINTPSPSLQAAGNTTISRPTARCQPAHRRRLVQPPLLASPDARRRCIADTGA